jgi:hypothetical protein
MRWERNRVQARGLVLVAVFLICVALLSSGLSAAETTEEAFQRLATQFEFLGIRELLYGNSEIYLADPGAMQSYRQVLTEFRGRNDTADEVLPLLHHANPKVRLLAIMALYLKGADHALPAINALAVDEAATYPNPPPDQQRAGASGIGPPIEPRTVGTAAQAVVKFYIAASSVPPFNDDPFAQYWRDRKDRQYCASVVYHN